MPRAEPEVPLPTPPEAEGGGGETGDGEAEAEEAMSPFPPAGTSKMPPRFANSPVGGVRKEIDWTIVYNVHRLEANETNLPNGGLPPTFDICVQCVNHFMAQSYYVYKKMLERKLLTKASAGHEQGDEKKFDEGGNPHAQQAVTALTSRKKEYWKGFMKAILDSCILPTYVDAYFHRIAITVRGSQSHEYQYGYTKKQDGEPLYDQDGLQGNWTLGITPEMLEEYCNTYWAHRTNDNTGAYKKGGGGAGGYQARFAKGKNKLLDVRAPLCWW